jgi:hypothetical protein
VAESDAEVGDSFDHPSDTLSPSPPLLLPDGLLPLTLSPPILPPKLSLVFSAEKSSSEGGGGRAQPVPPEACPRGLKFEEGAGGIERCAAGVTVGAKELAVERAE